MCGRYSLYPNPDDPRVSAILSMMDRRYPGAYKTGEIFPGDRVPAIVADRGRIVPVPAVFGFPGFEPGRRLINARAETAAQKPTFALALQRSRTVLPAAGFFEWSREGEKQKYLCTLPDEAPLYLCGLLKRVQDETCFVILTRPANDSMRRIHHRMPVIIPAAEVRAYLTDAHAAARLLAVSAPELLLRAV